MPLDCKNDPQYWFSISSSTNRNAFQILTKSIHFCIYVYFMTKFWSNEIEQKSHRQFLWHLLCQNLLPRFYLFIFPPHWLKFRRGTSDILCPSKLETWDLKIRDGNHMLRMKSHSGKQNFWMTSWTRSYPHFLDYFWRQRENNQDNNNCWLT